jgi:hypothetical protein
MKTAEGLLTLTLRSLQLPHPRRDFLCALSFRLASFPDDGKLTGMPLSRDNAEVDGL